MLFGTRIYLILSWTQAYSHDADSKQCEDPDGKDMAAGGGGSGWEDDKNKSMQQGSCGKFVEVPGMIL
jgi:hypothetical protein